jgi:hypothetical protein
MKLAEAIRTVAEDLLNEKGRARAEEICATVRAEYGDLVDMESGRLIDASLWKAARDYFRSQEEASTEDEEQRVLPGIDFPRVLCIQHDSDRYVVKSLDANAPEIRAGRLTRVSNLTRAQKKLDRYDEIADRVLPLMERKNITFGSALRQLGLWGDEGSE